MAKNDYSSAKKMEQFSQYSSYGMGVIKTVSGITSAKKQYSLDKFAIKAEETNAEIELIETKANISKGITEALKQSREALGVVYESQTTDQVSSGTQSQMFSISEFMAGQINDAKTSTRIAEANYRVAMADAKVKKVQAKNKKRNGITGAIIGGITDIATIGIGGAK
jgi:hypothetical protein